MHYNNEAQLLPEFESITVVNSKPDGIIGNDTRKRINDTTAAPFKYICAILIGANVKRPDERGTGVLIGPRTVMTAAHNVYGHDAGIIRIIPGRNSLMTKWNVFGEYKATNIIMSYPSYNAEDHHTPKDYAIIHIDKDISTTIGHWGKKSWKGDELGSSFLTGKYMPGPAGIQKINICGYPGDKGSNTQYLSYDKTLKFNKERNELFFLNDVTEGTSGSPMWIRRSSDNGGRVLVGITTFVNPLTGYNGGVFLNDEVRTFMKKNTI
jgi:V8-like Glu-specific endopeptidase